MSFGHRLAIRGSLDAQQSLAIAMPDPASADLLLTAALSGVVFGEAGVLSLLLAADRDGRQVHAWIIVALLALALNALDDLRPVLSSYEWLGWLSPLTSVALLVVGPALWLYSVALTARDGQGPRWRWHLAPVALLAALLAGEQLVGGTSDTPAPPAGAVDLASLPFLSIYLGIYLLLAVRRVERAREWLRDERSTLEGRTLGWLVSIVVLLGVVFALWVGASLLGCPHAGDLATALLIVALATLGVSAVRQRNVFDPRLGPWSKAEDPAEAAQAAPFAQPTESATGRRKYARAPLDGALAAELRQRLDRVMVEDKPYLQSDLTLAELARQVGIRPHQLSQLLSQHLGLSFYDFVNRYRVEAVQATLTRPGSARRPLLEIALECGFASKSTFNDAFKRLTGRRPSDFRRSSGDS